MIGKRAAEHGVVANLCIPDRFILVVTSYHSFHFKARGHSSDECGLDLTRTRIFLPQIIPSTKILSPKKYLLHSMTHTVHTDKSSDQTIDFLRTVLSHQVNILLPRVHDNNSINNLEQLQYMHLLFVWMKFVSCI